MRHADLTLSGVNFVPRQRCAVYRPARPADHAALLQNPAVTSVVARGAGRSYGDAALNQNAAVAEQVWLDRLLAFDTAAGTATCEPGLTLERLIAAVLPHGWFPKSTPGTQLATVGGCVAADVHGKNHHVDGGFAESVVAFDLLTPDGLTHTCRPDTNPDLYWSTLGGMGLTGFIQRVTLQLKPVTSAYLDVRYRQTANVHGLFDAFEADPTPTYSVAWLDCLATGDRLGRGVLIEGEHAAADTLTGPAARAPLTPPPRRVVTLPVHLPGFALNRLSVKAFNAAYYRKHASGTAVERYDAFFYPLDAVRHWMRGYGRRGFVQYQTVLPDDGGREGIVKQLQTIAASGQSSFLSVLKRFGAQSRGWLSFPHPGYTLALDLPNRGSRLHRLIRELDAITLDHGGRVYLAKDSFLQRPAFDRMYPHADRFRALRQHIDPDRRINSSLARRLGLNGA